MLLKDLLKIPGDFTLFVDINGDFINVVDFEISIENNAILLIPEQAEEIIKQDA